MWSVKRFGPWIMAVGFIVCCALPNTSRAQSDAANFGAIICQQGGSYLFSDGVDELTDLGIDQLATALFNPIDDLTTKQKKKIRKAATKAAVGATLAALCPPILVGQGFSGLSENQRKLKALTDGFTPPAPRAFTHDVDNPASPASCTYQNSFAQDGSERIQNFGPFDGPEWAYVDPFGPYPSFADPYFGVNAASEYFKQKIREQISFPDIGLDGLIDFSINLPSIGVSLDDIIPGLSDLIIGAVVDTLNLQDALDAVFQGWRGYTGDLRAAGAITTSGTGSKFYAGEWKFRVAGVLRSPLSFNNVTYDQGFTIKEYFPPVYQVLRIENAGTADERHIVAEYVFEALDANGANRGFTPPYFAAGNLIGTDNCDPNPRLFNDFPISVPLGTHYFPIGALDRSGNHTTLNYVVKVTVVDTLPPTIEQPAAAAIVVPAGTTSIAFTAPGVGCTTYLCNTNTTPTPKLFPPLFFDFATLTPAYTCSVIDSGNNTQNCATAQLQTGSRYTVRWAATDSSGNAAHVDQIAVVRAVGSNRAPTTPGTTVTVAAGIVTPITLQASDPDLDPLTWRIRDVPDHGDIPVTPTPLYQTRFTLTGTSEQLSSHVEYTYGVDTEDRIAIADPSNQRIIVQDSNGNIVDGRFYANRNPFTLTTVNGLESFNTNDAIPAELVFGDWQRKRIFTVKYTNDTGLDLTAYLGANPRHMVALSDPINGQESKYFVITDPGATPGAAGTLRVLRVSLSDTAAQNWTVAQSFLATMPSPGGVPIRPTGIAIDCNSLTVLVADWDNRRMHRIALGSAGAITQASLDNMVVSQTYDMAFAFVDPPGDGLAQLNQPQDIARGSCGGTIKTIDNFTRQIRSFGNFTNAGLTSTTSTFNNIGTRFVNIERASVVGQRGAESFFVLQDVSISRFDRFGRLLGEVPTVDPSSSGNANGITPFSPNIGGEGDTKWVDMAVYVDAALGRTDVFAISQGTSTSFTPVLGTMRWGDGFGQYTEGYMQTTVSSSTSDQAFGRSVAFDPTTQRVYALTSHGMEFRVRQAGTHMGLWPVRNLFTSSGNVSVASTDTQGNPLFWSTTMATEVGTANYQNLDRVRVDPTGAVYITEPVKARIHKFQPNGTYIGWLGKCTGGSGCNVAAQHSNGFSCSVSACTVSGGVNGNGQAQFNTANAASSVQFALAFDNTLNQFYVSDAIDVAGQANQLPRVQTFSLAGAWLSQITPTGQPDNILSFVQPGDFARVNDLAVNDQVFFVVEGDPLRRVHAFDVQPFAQSIAGATINYTPNVGYTGADQFSYDVVDAFSAASAIANVNITVVNDTTAPTLSCPTPPQGQTFFTVEVSTPGGAKTISPGNTAGGSAELTDILAQVTASDNITVPAVTLTNDAPTLFPINVTTNVHYTARDAVGLTSQCTVPVRVTDTQPPIFAATTLPDVVIEATALLTLPSAAALPVPSVSDLGGAVSVVNDVPAQGLPLGDTTIVWTATDGAGNRAVLRQNITIRDTRAPMITRVGGMPVGAQTFVATNGHTNVANFEMPVANDEVGLARPISCTPQPGDPVASVELLVECVAVDTTGNKASVEFSVFVTQPDGNNDHVSDLVAAGASAFSDAGLGGQTAGNFSNPGNEAFTVGDAWRPAQGLRLAVRPPVAGNSQFVARACANQVTLDQFARVDDIDGTPIDNEISVTCAAGGFAIDKHIGISRVGFTFPGGSAATQLEAPNDFTLTGTIFHAEAANPTPIVVTAGSRTLTVAPGDDVDLARAVNQPPTTNGMPGQTLSEDTGTITTDLKPVFDDAEDADAALTIVVLSNNNLALFDQLSIAPTTQILSMRPRADAFGVADVVLRAFDTYGDYVDQPLRITVAPVNDAPSFTLDAPITVLEDVGEITRAGFANASVGPANEAGQTITYDLLSIDAPALFAVPPSINANGTLNFTVAPNAYGVATLTFGARDSGGTALGGFDTAVVNRTTTITITPVNDAPTFTIGADQTIGEDAGAQTVVNWAQAIDEGPGEGGQTAAFEIVGNDQPSFFAVAPTVDAAGTLRYTPAANALGTATIALRLRDDGGTANGGIDVSATQNFRITIASVNDPPSFTLSGPITVDEDSGAFEQTGFAQGSAGPPDESAQTLSYTLTANSDASLFSAAPSIDASGTLRFTPAADANGVATVEFEVRDDGGTANGGIDVGLQRRTSTITVRSVNDAPSFTAGGDRTVNEDAGPITVNDWATQISAGPANESNQSVSFTVASNDAPQLFSSAPAVDGQGTLRFTPAANAWGVANLTLRAVDSGGVANGGVDSSALVSLRITIAAVNDPPTLTLGADPSYAPGTSGMQNIASFATATPGPNEPDQQIALLAVTEVTDANNVVGAATIDPNGTLHLNLTGTGGTARLAVTATDTSGVAASNSTTVEFNVVVAPGADLQAAISNLRDLVVLGQPQSYVIIIANRSDLPVANARVVSTAPATLTGQTWSCVPDPNSQCASTGTGAIDTLVNLAPREAVILVLEGVASERHVGDFSVQVEVTAPQGLPDPLISNNIATDTDPVNIFLRDGFETLETLEGFIERVLGRRR